MQAFSRSRITPTLAVSALLVLIMVAGMLAQPAGTGPKKRVAVLEFGVEASGASDNVGSGVTDMLIDALVNSGKYIVLERSELDEVIKEQNLGSSGRVTSETAAEAGKLLGAQLLVKGVVTEFKENESGGGIGGIVGGKVGIGVGKVSSHIAYTIRLIDAETGQVLDSYRAEEKVSKKGLAVGTKVGKTPVGGAFFKSASMEEAINKSIGKTIDFLDEQTKDMVWQGSVVMVGDGGQVYINAGSNSGISVGDQFEISHAGKALIDPETGLNLGTTTKKIGCIEITSVEEKFSIGKVLAGSGGQRKDIVKYSGGCSGGSYETFTPTKEAGSATSSSTSGSAAPASTKQVAATVTTEAPASGPVAEDMTLYTKYDFVPGNKVIFYDDLSGDYEADFPHRWKLKNGTFEVARLGAEKWILCTDNGSIIPKIAEGPLPKRYTVEMEFYAHGGKEYSNNYKIHWTDAEGDKIADLSVGYYGLTNARFSFKGRSISDMTFSDQPLSKGVHTMRIMANERGMKAYIDNTRVANMPLDEEFAPTGFQVELRPWDANSEYAVLVRNFRFAEGGPSMKEQLDETGKVVTHGILFDSGSSTIKAESYRTLKEIGNLMTDEPSLKLSVEGHTDSDGADDYNMDLSKSRARSVVDYLTSEFGIAADRLEFKGWGESKPIDSNDTPEGKANNRRVELVKI
jgi:OOP family OmpA-OmpF porin